MKNGIRGQDHSADDCKERTGCDPKLVAVVPTRVNGAVLSRASAELGIHHGTHEE